jgi:guanylate kinase
MSIVFIISAPSGSGKSTLVGGLRRRDSKLMFSISYTTRAPRGAEKEGESYHYIDRASFLKMIDGEEFLEWADVFGNYYGTHRSYLDRAREAGCDLLLDIDVQGARQLKDRIPGAVSIFILAPSRQTLEQRLRARSEDSEEVIKRRLREAAEEIRNYRNYDYVLVNHDVNESVSRLKAIVDAERIRRERMEREIEPILASFGASTQEVSR